LAITTAQGVRKTKRRPRASLVIDPTFCLEFIVIASLAKYQPGVWGWRKTKIEADLVLEEK